jgi:hypothetical protein
MTKTDLEQVEKQLGLILKVLAAFTVQGKSLTDGSQFLDRLGVDRGVIAGIYGTTPSSVRGRLSEAKKGQGKK